MSQRKGGVIIGIHKGTKLTNTPKNKTLNFRYDANIENKLNYICNFTKKTKAQVIRDGIIEQYNKIKK